jgi:TonB family protein
MISTNGIKALIGLVGFAAFAACNSNSSSDKISDTASTPVYSSPDAVPAPADTTTAMAPMDTSSTTTAAAKAVTPKKRKIVVEFVPVTRPQKPAADKSGIYAYSEVSPTFPGGQSAIEDYINNHIEYPQLALDNNTEGRTSVSFVVNEDGKLSDAHLMGTPLGEGLDQEAVRVVSAMPKWTPGTVKGKPVKTRMTLPIVFEIQE